MMKPTIPFLSFLLSVFLISSCKNNNEISLNPDPEFSINNPYFVPFNGTHDFSTLKAGQAKEALDVAIAYFDSVINTIAEIPASERTFSNTMNAFDVADALVEKTGFSIYLIGYVHPDSSIRANANEQIIRFDLFRSNLYLNEKLYKSIKEYAETEEANSLSRPQKKFLEDMIGRCELKGLALDSAKKAQLAILNGKISELGATFQKNINDYNDHIFVSESDLEGFDEAYKAPRKQTDGRYKIDMSYPSYIPFVEKCVSAEKRKEIYIKFQNRAADKNPEVLLSLLKERKKMAHLLGFKSFAEYQLADRMAKKTDVVWDFENGLIEKLLPLAQKEYDEILTYAKKYEKNPNLKAINSWDFSFYDKKYVQETYNYDKEVSKEYFELEAVIQGIFDICKKIYNIDIKEVESPLVWHEDVRLYEVFENEKLIGRFYFDLFPRANKYGHAACFEMTKGRLTSNGYQTPTTALVCNYPKPTPDAPSLLYHNDVRTFFHEFGHVLHNVLTTTDINYFAGVEVYRDFVEAPSQMFENWIYDKEVLKGFAKHYKTGETIPDDLIDKIVLVRNVGSGINNLGQLKYGILDLTLHDKFDPEGDKTIIDIQKECSDKANVFPYLEGTNPIMSFGHLHEYAASYYGYMWSKVYAQDMFSVFETEGLLNPETGKRYRDLILASGGSEDPLQLVETFLGRKSNNKAFLSYLGVE